MKKSFAFFVVAALFVVAFAEDTNSDEDNGDVDHPWMVRYCKLLRDNGYIPEYTNKDMENASVLQLIDLAIKALEVAKVKRPDAAKAKQLSIEFFEEAREKWAHDEPSDPLQPSPTDPTKPTKAPKKRNFIARAFSKLMNWFRMIFSRN